MQKAAKIGDPNNAKNRQNYAKIVQIRPLRLPRGRIRLPRTKRCRMRWLPPQTDARIGRIMQKMQNHAKIVEIRPLRLPRGQIRLPCTKRCRMRQLPPQTDARIGRIMQKMQNHAKLGAQSGHEHRLNYAKSKKIVAEGARRWCFPLVIKR